MDDEDNRYFYKSLLYMPSYQKISHFSQDLNSSDLLLILGLSNDYNLGFKKENIQKCCTAPHQTAWPPRPK